MVALCGIIVINMKEISCMFRASACCKFVLRKVLTSEVRALGVQRSGLTLRERPLPVLSRALDSSTSFAADYDSEVAPGMDVLWLYIPPL